MAAIAKKFVFMIQKFGMKQNAKSRFRVCLFLILTRKSCSGLMLHLFFDFQKERVYLRRQNDRTADSEKPYE